MFKGLELCLHAFRDQIKSESDSLILFVHWYLIQKGFQCIVDGRNSEILPDNWNSNGTEYIISYTSNSKGYEMKALVVEDSLIINLMKKSDERTANITCIVKDHITNYKANFQERFMNLEDLNEKLETEFTPLTNSTKPSEQLEKSAETRTEPIVDPLRVGPPRIGGYNPQQQYPPPDNYGRSDLEPFGGFDPLRSGGGMIFDPFRGGNRNPRIPSNLPPGAVPPGARYDPFGPPMPDDLTGQSAMRAGPNPSHLRPPNFDDFI